MTYTTNQMRQAFTSGKAVGLQTALILAKEYNLTNEIKDLESRLEMFQNRLAKLKKETK